MSFKILNLTLLILIAFSVPKILQALRYVSHKNCKYVEKGTILANPGNCSQYIICNGLRSTLGECPKGLYFNEEMLSCDRNPLVCREWKTTTTSTTTTTTAAPTTTTAASTTLASSTVGEKANENYTETDNFILPFCHPSQTYNIPYLFNCFYYYECVNGVLTLKRCPRGFAFDWILRRCVLLADVNCYFYGK